MDLRVLRLYKSLLFLGKIYPVPGGYVAYRDKVHDAFIANRSLEEDEDALAKAIANGRWAIKEMEGLLFLRTYRGMKKKYGYD